MNLKSDVQFKLVQGLGQYNISLTLLRNANRRKLDLNIADMECLDLLFYKNISSPTELARYTGLTTGSTTAMLDRLEKAGLIRRKLNPEDRRGILIEVSENTSSIFRNLMKDIRHIQIELFNSYSDEELEIVAGFLNKFSQNIKDYTAKLEENLEPNHKSRMMTND